MITFLLKKLDKAIRMAVEQEQAWLVLHDTLDSRLTGQWAEMSTEATRVNKKWTSVFLLSEQSSHSQLKTVLDLNTQEWARVINGATTKPGYTAPSWISEGIDIEKVQAKLHIDVATFGDKMTDRQTTEVYTRRKSLSSRLAAHRTNVALFIDIKLEDIGSQPTLAQETDGQPEHATLHLPSHLVRCVAMTECSRCIIEVEKIIRRSECFETLRRIRTACSQKSQMLIGKGKNARGEIANTRAQVMIGRLDQRVKNATADYTASYNSLKKLGLTVEHAMPLRPLDSKHFSGLMSILRGRRELGEGRKKLPWFWIVREMGVDATAAEAEAEFTESIMRKETPDIAPIAFAKVMSFMVYFGGGSNEAQPDLKICMHAFQEYSAQFPDIAMTS
ncbi:hypothetical protein FRC11_012095 [Ceratobasidium sp. 423]|nr:hypothetical protein FRC11_012095 [Ceratobasidium sp. 423]